MEDHLKNKNRLEKEWEALCAYQAEPNTSLVAQREENASKNRSLAVLTCTYLACLGDLAGGEEVGTSGCDLLHPSSLSAKPLSSTLSLSAGAEPTLKTSVWFPLAAIPSPKAIPLLIQW